MSSQTAGPFVDAVTAKVRQLRADYENKGYQVVERPGPEEFPFEIGYSDRYCPAMIARRGDETAVFEIREAVRSIGRLTERSEEIRKHPNWRFFLISCEDVVPHDAPGIQGEPPSWPELAHTAAKTLSSVASAPVWIQLVSLWACLEGVLRRIAVDEGIPVDLLPASTLIPALYDYGLIPMDSYEPLMSAYEVHRRVRHGFSAPDDSITDAIEAVRGWIPRLLSAPVERAA